MRSAINLRIKTKTEEVQSMSSASPSKAIVCIKQVPDTETKIKLRADNNGIDTTGIKWVMNPYDEYAVEEAIKMREAGNISQVVVLSLGPKSRTSDVLRTALAMGADEAVLIDGPEDLDAHVVATALSAAIKLEGEFKVILTGRLSIDGNAASVGQMLAEYLNIPHSTVVTKIVLDGAVAQVDREIDGGSRELLQLKLPALMAANKGLNMPRYASLPGIMKAKKKVIKEIALDTLGIAAGAARIRHINFSLPKDKPSVNLLSGESSAQVQQLTKLLREEAKVI
jgi:electron transfer flavoprotein beta subunit